MQLFYEPLATTSEFILNPEEARHCLKVLRKNIGDTIYVVDGRGNTYTCKILSSNVKNCQLKVIQSQLEPSSDFLKHIAISPTKNLDRIEWFIEKSVEIGIDKVSFILCKNSERRVIRHDRLHKKAVSAMKQSLKSSLPSISELVPFEELVLETSESLKLIAHLDNDHTLNFSEAIQPRGSTTILIGPEGGFTQHEVQFAKSRNFKSVSLGKSRLRTETAGIVACTFLNS